MLVSLFSTPNFEPIELKKSFNSNFADFAKISKKLHDKRYKRKKRGGR